MITKSKTVGTFENAQSLKLIKQVQFDIIYEVVVRPSPWIPGQKYSIKNLLLFEHETGAVKFFFVIGFVNEYQMKPSRLKAIMNAYDCDKMYQRFVKQIKKIDFLQDKIN